MYGAFRTVRTGVPNNTFCSGLAKQTEPEHVLPCSGPALGLQFVRLLIHYPEEHLVEHTLDARCDLILRDIETLAVSVSLLVRRALTWLVVAHGGYLFRTCRERAVIGNYAAPFRRTLAALGVVRD